MTTNNFSASVSTSSANITTVNLVVNGKKITLRLLGDVLGVDVDEEGMLINTKLPICFPDPEMLHERIEKLGLHGHIWRQLNNRGLNLIYQVVESEELFGSNPNSSRKGWIEAIDIALAKFGLFRGINTSHPKIVNRA